MLTHLPVFQTPGVQRYSPIREHGLDFRLSVQFKETNSLQGISPCPCFPHLPQTMVDNPETRHLGGGSLCPDPSPPVSGGVLPLSGQPKTQLKPA